jgi:hypothetical protein
MTPRYVKQKIETKRIKRARQDLQPSLTRRQVTRLQLKTIVERFYSRYTFIQGKKRGVTLGSCG